MLGGHPKIRVCLELDVSWRPLAGGRVHIGTRRSPLHTPAQAADVRQGDAGRPGFQLVGVMAYEGQIAGLGDSRPGEPLRGAAVRWMQATVVGRAGDRRAAAVAAVTALAPLEFVNGGGTGSLEVTAASRR